MFQEPLTAIAEVGAIQSRSIPSPPVSESVAVIDVGSNSCRLVIYSPHEGGHFRIEREEKAALQLLLSVDKNGQLSDSAQRRLTEVLKDFCQLASSAGVSRVLAAGTAIFRVLERSEEIVERIQDETGLTVEIIDGELEARLGFTAAVGSLPVDSGCYIDIGGGSTELVSFTDRAPEQTTSLPIGCLTVSSRYFGQQSSTSSGLDSTDKHVEKKLRKSNFHRRRFHLLVGTGGTVRNVARIHRAMSGFKFSRVHGYVMSRSDVESVYTLLRSLSKEDLKDVVGLNHNRTHSILGGTALLMSMMRQLEADELMISGRGIRESIANFGLGSPPDTLPSRFDSRAKAIDAVCSRFSSWNRERAEWRSRLFDRLISTFDDLLPKRFNELAKYAVIAVDVGSSLDYYNRWSHAANVIEKAELNGFDHRDISVVSGVLKAAANPDRALSKYGTLLSDADRQIILGLGVVVAIADGIVWRAGTASESVTFELSKNSLEARSDSLVNWDVRELSDYLRTHIGVSFQTG